MSLLLADNDVHCSVHIPLMTVQPSFPADPVRSSFIYIYLYISIYVYIVHAHSIIASRGQNTDRSREEKEHPPIRSQTTGMVDCVLCYFFIYIYSKRFDARFSIFSLHQSIFFFIWFPFHQPGGRKTKTSSHHQDHLIKQLEGTGQEQNWGFKGHKIVRQVPEIPAPAFLPVAQMCVDESNKFRLHWACNQVRVGEKWKWDGGDAVNSFHVSSQVFTWRTLYCSSHPTNSAGKQRCRFQQYKKVLVY